MTDVVFLEYTHNPDSLDAVSLISSLDAFGFVCRTRHNLSGVEVWAQASVILLLRPDVTASSNGVTGIGVLADPGLVDQMPDAVYDPDTDFHVIRNQHNTFRIYLVEDQKPGFQYQTVNTTENTGIGLKTLAGLVLDTDDQSVLSMLMSVSSTTTNTEHYQRFLFSNKFTVFVESVRNAGVTKLIADTADVFKTTSSLAIAQVELLPFTGHPDSDFGALNHKIAGYNCAAFGNADSYSIENYALGGVLNVDLIFRERKKYIKIRESTLQYYDSIRNSAAQ